MGKFYSALNIGVLFLLFSACGGGGGGSGNDGQGGSTSEKEKEQIRFINVIKSESSVNVQLGEDIFVEELAYGDATSFFEGPEGEKIEFVVTSSEKVIPVLSATPTIAKAAKQSYVLVDEAGTVSYKAIDETGTAPLPGQFRLRFLNLSQDKASVDVFLVLPDEDIEELTAAKSALAFNTVSDYVSIPSGTYDIVYTEAGSTTILRRARSVVFDSGSLYTHYLIDNIDGRGQLSRLTEDMVF